MQLTVNELDSVVIHGCPTMKEFGNIGELSTFELRSNNEQYVQEPNNFMVAFAISLTLSDREEALEDASKDSSNHVSSIILTIEGGNNGKGGDDNEDFKDMEEDEEEADEKEEETKGWPLLLLLLRDARA
ncbi:hypothetical protein CUMW_184500 [Citrus unshiu]|uniref:Uncharacterized protein n=1 Tax=Citrus unshiu TaxID=55188 RepID=A0A2H5Q1C5_CITUN|nr:hypothetical protein CUMW_184500 [Citrus unshiu]